MIESTNTKYKQKRFIKTDRNIKVSFFFTPTVFTHTTGWKKFVGWRLEK